MCDLSPIVELSTGEFSSESRSAFDGKSFMELKAAVEKCCSQQPNVCTVMNCATLAQQFSDLAQEVSRSCELLVHDQHLQHQVGFNLLNKYNLSLFLQCPATAYYSTRGKLHYFHHHISTL